ncbi:MAG: VOC family protein [Planctomycetaceae bacterium]|nr:VOC family protein [Planctomycetaceae bacterium]
MLPASSSRTLCGLLFAVTLVAPATQAQDTPKPSAPALYASTTIDLGTVVSDLEKSAKWYTEVLGMKELPSFEAPGEFAGKIGLSNKLSFKVRVFTLGEGEHATKLKLMQFKTSPGARVDQTFIHSSYGFRYLTLFVSDMDASIKLAAEKGAKPIGTGVTPLPEGFPEGIFIAVLRDPDGNFVELVGPKAK